MNRKEFLTSVGKTCLCLIGTTALLNSCAAPVYMEAKTENEILKIDLKNFTIDSSSSSFRDYIIVKPDISNFPIVIYRNSDKDYTALLLRCSHQGNELNVYGELLTCPAHGSEFNKMGKALNGPASEPLISFPVQIQKDYLIINLA